MNNINLGQSFLQATQGQLTFVRLPETVFYLQKFPVPGISLGTIEQPTPFANLPVPGTKLKYEPLTVTFLLDEQMTSWYDIFNWMNGIGRPQNADQYKNLMAAAPPVTTGIRPPYSDAILTTYTAKNKPSIQFSFADCFPVELTGVEFDYTLSAEAILTAKATFVYSYYNFTRLSS